MKKANLLNREAGAVLLAMMLVLVVSASFVLVSKLNAAARQYTRQSSSLAILNEAKNALIGYAVNYPEHSLNGAPGTLPCPDINNDGSAVGNCSYPTTTLGRFPWSTLEMEKTRDYSGAVLWYAVANNFRTPQVGAINSDTTGNLSVDGNNDIVAVIIAPGPPVSGQQRADDPLDKDNYLEADNADADTDYVSRANGEFNDTLVTITRQELMQAVEKRVLGEVAQTISTYQTQYAAFPWLTPFADPSTSTFRGQAATMRGHLPFHWAADPDSVVIGTGSNIAGRNPFTTDITLSWDIADADVSDPGNTSYGSASGFDAYSGDKVTPDRDCIISNVCTDGNYPGLSIASAITFSAANCTWSNKEKLQCTGTHVVTDVNNYPQQTVSIWGYAFNVGNDELIYRHDGSQPQGVVLGQGMATGWNWNTQIQYAYTETVTRTYTIDITFTDNTADGADITPPTAGTTRTRELTLEDDGSSLFSTGSSTVTLTITDDRRIDAVRSDSSLLTLSTSATRTLTNDADTTGTITASGILYDIDVDDGELPAWFVQNGWQDLIYVSYASGESLPGNVIAGQDCVSLATNCLTVNANGLVINNVRAVVVSAGVDLPAAGARPSAALSDYFEDDNSNPVDDVFVKNRITAAYNDQTRIVAVAP